MPKKNIQDREDDLKQCFFIFRVFGMQFFSIDKSFILFDPKNSRRWPTIGYILYFIFLMIIFGTQQVFGVLEMDFDFENAEKSSVKTVINRMMKFGIVLTFLTQIILMIIFSITTTHLQKCVVHNMLIIAEQFDVRLKVKISFRKFKRIFLIKLSIYFCSYFLILFFMNHFKVFFEIHMIKYFSWIWSTLIRTALTGKLFTLYVNILNHYLEAIASSIDENMIDKLVLVSNPDGQLKNLVKIKSFNCNEIILYDKLCALRSIYGLIWNTTGLINQCYGKILLFYIILTVISVTVALYKVFLLIVSDLPYHEAIGKFLVTLR
jgi:hypothetical protein